MRVAPSALTLLFQFLHQAGFANPGLTAQQHHLAGARFGLFPALPQQSQLGFAADQGSEPLLHGHLKARVRFPFAVHAIQRREEPRRSSGSVAPSPHR